MFGRTPVFDKFLYNLRNSIDARFMSKKLITFAGRENYELNFLQSNFWTTE